MSISIYATDHNRPHPRLPEFPAAIHFEVGDPRNVNWSNANASILFALLGVGESLIGEAPLPDVRRGIIRARATFDTRAPKLARPDAVAYGAPRTCDDGTVELRPIRMLSFGLDEEGMRTRLVAFERAVEALADLEATHIAWD